MSARLVDRVLRDIQRGLSLMQTCLAHGLTADQLELLQQCVAEVEKKTAFKITPRASDKPNRSARSFRDARDLGGILDVLAGEPAHSDVEQARAVSMSYMLWANKSKRDDIKWPRRDIDRLVALLTKLGVAAKRIDRYPVPEDKGFERVELLRSTNPKKSLNHVLAWSLVVIYVAASVSESQ